jgi:hypothetical protein
MPSPNGLHGYAYQCEEDIAFQWESHVCRHQWSPFKDSVGQMFNSEVLSIKSSEERFTNPYFY